MCRKNHCSWLIYICTYKSHIVLFDVRHRLYDSESLTENFKLRAKADSPEIFIYFRRVGRTLSLSSARIKKKKDQVLRSTLSFKYDVHTKLVLITVMKTQTAYNKKFHKIEKQKIKG